MLLVKWNERGLKGTREGFCNNMLHGVRESYRERCGEEKGKLGCVSTVMV